MSRKSTGVIITLKLDLFLNSIWTSEAAALWKKTKVHHLLVKSFFFLLASRTRMYLIQIFDFVFFLRLSPYLGYTSNYWLRRSHKDL